MNGRALAVRALTGAALATLAVVLGLAACEAYLRLSCSRAAVDVRRASFTLTRVWAAGSMPLEPQAPGQAAEVLPRACLPNISFSQYLCGVPHRFTTRLVPGAAIGYRVNDHGPGGDAPVFGVALGDSFTEGAQVDDAEAWPNALSALAGRRFLNLGVRAQGTTSHLERLKASGTLRSRPSVLLLQVHKNDLVEDAWLELSRRAHRQGRSLGVRLGGRAFYDWVAETLGLKLWKYSVLVCFLDQRLLRPRFARRVPAPLADGALERAGLAIQARNLEELSRLGQSWGMGLAVLGERAYLRTLRSACSGAAQAEALWIETDVSPAERLRFDGHWNRAGHLETCISAS